MALGPQQNRNLQMKMARDTVKIRRAENGYVINTDAGMSIAKDLAEVQAFLNTKFGKTIDVKPV